MRSRHAKTSKKRVRHSLHDELTFIRAIERRGQIAEQCCSGRCCAVNTRGDRSLAISSWRFPKTRFLELSVPTCGPLFGHAEAHQSIVELGAGLLPQRCYSRITRHRDSRCACIHYALCRGCQRTEQCEGDTTCKGFFQPFLVAGPAQASCCCEQRRELC